jgi:hypothetical protein
MYDKSSRRLVSGAPGGMWTLGRVPNKFWQQPKPYSNPIIYWTDVPTKFWKPQAHLSIPTLGSLIEACPE